MLFSTGLYIDMALGKRIDIGEQMEIENALANKLTKAVFVQQTFIRLMVTASWAWAITTNLM